MKTKELVIKYQKLLAPILGCQAEDIIIRVGGFQVGEYLDREKNSMSTRNFSLGDFSIIFPVENLDKNKFNKELATFKLYEMPHCCGIMVSCNAFVNPLWRNKGIGKIMNNLRQEIGRGLGYSVMFCTDIESNEHQRKLLATQGFKDIFNFVNKRTQSRVYMSIVNL